MPKKYDLFNQPKEKYYKYGVFDTSHTKSKIISKFTTKKDAEIFVKASKNKNFKTKMLTR
jgi:hypothetical protein